MTSYVILITISLKFLKVIFINMEDMHEEL